MVDQSELNLPPIAAGSAMLAAASPTALGAKEPVLDSPEVEPEQTEPLEDGAKAPASAPASEDTPAPARPSGIFFDGLQFYKTLTGVGRSAVQSAVDTAVARASRAKRARPDSIALIRERYPDFICLLPAATRAACSPSAAAVCPHAPAGPPQIDLLSALLLSSSAAAEPRRPPTKRPKEDVEHADIEQVRRAAALASPPRQSDGGASGLRVA